MFHDRFNSQSASISGSAVLTSYFAIFRDQTHNKYGVYLFRAFQNVKTALAEVCVDWLFLLCEKITRNTWYTGRPKKNRIGVWSIIEQKSFVDLQNYFCFK